MTKTLLLTHQKKDHPYFAQMQGPMFLLCVRFSDFFVWTPVENDYLLVRIERDEHFISNTFPKLDEYFLQSFYRR